MRFQNQRVASASSPFKLPAPHVGGHGGGGGGGGGRGGGSGLRGGELGSLEVHECLTALLYMALSLHQHEALLGVRELLESILGMWQGFSGAHPYPIAVFLQEEEIMCASDPDLCVALVFTLVSGGDHQKSSLQ